MTQALGLYGAANSANGDQPNNLLIGGNAVVNDWNYWDGWRPYPWWPTPPTVYAPVIVTTRHRICTCPNCDGSCCDCADCKVKRLEQRVADLEKEKAR